VLSVPHLVVIFIIALVVFGPEKLPGLARALGKAMADFRRVTTDFRTQIDDEMREMERQTRLQELAAAESAIPSNPSTSFGEPAATPAVAAPAAAPAAEPAVTPAEHTSDTAHTPDTASSENPTDGHTQRA
jgi:sec-independent protein translocase protein TatB